MMDMTHEDGTPVSWAGTDLPFTDEEYSEYSDLQLYPTVAVDIPKPIYHAARDMQAVVRHGQQNIIVVTAPTKNGPHRIQLEPVASKKHNMELEALQAKVDELFIVSKVSHVFLALSFSCFIFQL